MYKRTVKSLLSTLLAVMVVFSLASCEASPVNPGKTENGSHSENPVKQSFSVSEYTLMRDDLKIYGKLYVPENKEGKMPAVILSHSANLNADSLDSYAAGFAERGYIAYAFDFCGGSSKSRSDGASDDMTLFTEVLDLKAVISAIYARDDVDRAEIYLFGTSQGGLVSALAAEESDDYIKGEILLYPAYNIPELVRKMSSLGNLASMMGSGYSKAFSETLMDFDAYDHIGAFTGKVLIIHGSKDFIVNSSYSEKAKTYYTDCTLNIIEGAGHGFNSENYSMGGDFDDEVWKAVDEYLACN